MRQDVHFDSETDLIAYGLMTADGASAEQAKQVLKMWKDSCVVMYWSLDANRLVIQLTDIGVATQEAIGKTLN